MNMVHLSTSNSKKSVLLSSSEVAKLDDISRYGAQQHLTLFESENEWQKIEQVPILLPRASRNFPNVKTRNEIFFHNWTSEIIPFIRFVMQMDRTQKFFEMSKVAFFIVIQLCYNELWPFSHQKWSKIENLDILAFEKSQKIISKVQL